MRLLREGGFRQALVLLAGLFATARHKKLGLDAAYRVDGGDNFKAAKRIVEHLACGTDDERALWRAAEAETRRFVRQEWRTILDLAETLVRRESIEFDRAPLSVRLIERVEHNIAPLSPRDHRRIHECARVFAETGGKMCETARRMNMGEKTVGRYLSMAIPSSGRQSQGR
jgi:hypothetical protein